MTPPEKEGVAMNLCRYCDRRRSFFNHAAAGPVVRVRLLESRFTIG
jgi:hypothetical protein